MIGISYVSFVVGICTSCLLLAQSIYFCFSTFKSVPYRLYCKPLYLPLFSREMVCKHCLSMKFVCTLGTILEEPCCSYPIYTFPWFLFDFYGNAKIHNTSFKVSFGSRIGTTLDKEFNTPKSLWYIVDNSNLSNWLNYSNVYNENCENFL